MKKLITFACYVYKLISQESLNHSVDFNVNFNFGFVSGDSWWTDNLICMFSCSLFQLCFLHWCSWTDSFVSSFLSTTVDGWKSFLSHFQKDKTFLKYQSFKHLSPPHRMNAREIICYLTTMRESFSEHMHFTENILNRVIS